MGAGGGAHGGLNLEGIMGGLTGALDGSGHLDGSGKLDIGGLLDGLKGMLSGLPGGKELSAFCDELKGALSGHGDIDIQGLATGLQGMLSGSGKMDLGAALGIDVGGLIDGLKASKAQSAAREVSTSTASLTSSKASSAATAISTSVPVPVSISRVCSANSKAFLPAPVPPVSTSAASWMLSAAFSPDLST
jgi:hypothetical protein